MEWMLRLVAMGIDGEPEFKTRWRSVGLTVDIANLGMTLSGAKQLLVQVRRQVVAGAGRRPCDVSAGLPLGGGTYHLKDWRRAGFRGCSVREPVY
jgi:hypothetical protein